MLSMRSLGSRGNGVLLFQPGDWDIAICGGLWAAALSDAHCKYLLWVNGPALWLNDSNHQHRDQ